MKITEDQLQAQCVEWFRKKYPHVIIASFPNGGSRDIREAVKLKKTGCLAGMPDLFVPEVKSNSLPLKIGLFVELKVGKNKVTVKQFEVLAYLRKQGYYVGVCYTFEEFVEVVKEYFGDD